MEGGGGLGRVEVGSRVYRRKEMVSFVAVKRLGDGWEGREGYWMEGGNGVGCVAVGKPGLSQEKECFLLLLCSSCEARSDGINASRWIECER